MIKSRVEQTKMGDNWFRNSLPLSALCAVILFLISQYNFCVPEEKDHSLVPGKTHLEITAYLSPVSDLRYDFKKSPGGQYVIWPSSLE